MADNFQKAVEQNKYLIGGTLAGAAFGVGASALNVVSGCVQLAVYPVHMTVRVTQAAIEPFVRIVSPVVLLPAYTALGLLGGMAAQVAVDSEYNEEMAEKIDAEIEANEERDRKLDEVMHKIKHSGFNL